MPLALTGFSVDSVFEAKKSLRKLKPHQREQITILHFEFSEPHMVKGLHESYFKEESFVLGDSLPALRELRICVFSAQDSIMTREETEKAAHECPKPVMQDLSVAVKVE